MSRRRDREEEEDLLVRCDGCGREFSADELDELGKHRYCQDCITELELSETKKRGEEDD